MNNSEKLAVNPLREGGRKRGGKKAYFPR